MDNSEYRAIQRAAEIKREYERNVAARLEQEHRADERRETVVRIVARLRRWAAANDGLLKLAYFDAADIIESEEMHDR